ncbi:MAG: DsrE family protein [Gammaproteobacteria bacterium]|nr:DsrE family protein [Gammaproteobacteria bacterium]
MKARRGFLQFGLATVGAAFAALGAKAASAAHLPEHKKKHKVVYHLSSPNLKHAMFVLGNIRNHIKGVKDPQNLDVELVVHGPALKHFVVMDMDSKLMARLDALRADNLRFGACGNTMKAFKITADMLPEGLATPSSIHLPQGGVVRIMELQEQGYIYIRP